jgi:NADH:ubiquinone oxidoreductase subunit 3 (subunit A)
MTPPLVEYFPVLVTFLLAVVVAVALYALSYLAVLRTPDPEKLSAYECGFDPFEDSRSRFDVRFYLVAILFIIFDLEISFLFPWSLVLGSLDRFGFFNMVLFLLLLTFGFIYEWRKGALEW